MSYSHRKVETQFIEVISTGMGHVRFIVDGKAAVYESDNLDDAGDLREITEAEMLAKPAHLKCQRCMPRMVNGEVPDPTGERP